MIHLKPSAGLCNRMRAIDSGLTLARSLNTQLDIYWVRDKNLNCPFHLLFESIDDPHVRLYERSVRPLRFVPTYQYVYKFFRFLDLNQNAFSIRENERLKSLDFSGGFSRSLTIESFSRFFPNAHPFADFRPAKEIRDLAAARTADFDQHTIGVHIRRTDNWKSIAGSPDEAFIEQMRIELEAEPRSTFYLATDSPEVKKTFIEIYGDKVITTPYPVSRTTTGGVREALVELYALAATRKLLGSYWSSYSTTAAQLGNIPLVRITAELSDNAVKS